MSLSFFRILRVFIFAFLFLFALQNMSLAAEGGIVVWRLEEKSGVSSKDVDSISGIITSSVEKYSGQSVVSEADIMTIIKGEETRQKCGGNSSTSCIAEIGAALGVPEAVSGDLGRVGNIWVLNLRRINIRSAKVIGRASRQVDGAIDNLVMEVDIAVAKLFNAEATGMAVLFVRSSPEGAEISVNGRPLGKSPQKKYMPEGKVVIRATFPDYFDAEQTVVLKAGEQKTVDLELAPISMHTYTKWGHISFWPGLAFAAIGSGFVVLAKNEADNYNKRTGPSSSDQTSKTYGGIAIAGITMGSALMITGAVLWILAPDQQEMMKDNTISVGPSEDGAMVTLGGRW